jgi:hypothetical protein
VLLTGHYTDVQKCLGQKYIEAFSKEVRVVEASEFTGPDYGEAIEQMKEALYDTGAILIHGLENLDPRQAAALHVICDRESPLVRDGIVVMTSKYSLDDISYKWKETIDADKLPALLTRLKDRVVPVAWERILPCD